MQKAYEIQGIPFNEKFYQYDPLGNLGYVNSGRQQQRVIINNPVGQNKVLQIYPEAGIGHNLHREKEDSKLQVKGESVSVYKNTGPGTAMGVYSRLSQLQNKISPSMEIPMQHSFEGTHSDIILRNQTPTLKNHHLPPGSSPR